MSALVGAKGGGRTRAGVKNACLRFGFFSSSDMETKAALPPVFHPSPLLAFFACERGGVLYFRMGQQPYHGKPYRLKKNPFLLPLRDRIPKSMKQQQQLTHSSIHISQKKKKPYDPLHADVPDILTTRLGPSRGEVEGRTMGAMLSWLRLYLGGEIISQR